MTALEAHVFGVRETGKGHSVEIIRTDGWPHGSGPGFYMNWPPEIDSKAPAAMRLTG